MHQCMCVLERVVYARSSTNLTPVPSLHHWCNKFINQSVCQGFISRELSKDIPDEPQATAVVEMVDTDNSGDDGKLTMPGIPGMPPKPMPQMTYEEEMLEKVCQEIIATERNFRFNMETLLELYFKGLKGKSDLIADYDLLNIFQHVESVLGVSTSLLEHYDEEEAIILKSDGQVKLIRTRPKRLMQTYKFIEPYLKVYSAYCNHYEDSLDTLRRCYANNRKLEQWLDRVRHKPRCLGLGVIDLLIQPVQRICKYPLLFDELLKHMDSDDPQTRRMLEETRILITEVWCFLVFLLVRVHCCAPLVLTQHLYNGLVANHWAWLPAALLWGS